MAQIKGPAIFLAQFAGDSEPFNSLESITAWAKEKGFKGIQIPAWDSRFIDLDKASTSRDYCDELKGKCNGLEITELATHLQGQLVATHPAYDMMFDDFAPASVHNNPSARAEWATGEMIKANKACKLLGLNCNVTFSGALMWQTVYPWPQRPAGLVDTGFAELARRWKPILDSADANSVDIAFELHPGEDLHDGATFDKMLEACGNHPRLAINYDPSHFVLQCLDYLAFIDEYKDRIKAFHVKDAEFNPTGKAGVYGGYLSWADRPGRFRSVGDGQVDFVGIFSKLTQYGYRSWAVLEWECCIKDSEQGAQEGAMFIEDMLIDSPKKAFDDFAGGAANEAKNKEVLGLT